MAEKVQRRLQHFIDRKIAALFEPLFNMQRDETLAGMAKGFGFRMIEAMGVIDRRQVAGEVKEPRPGRAWNAAKAWHAVRPVHDIHAASFETGANPIAAGSLPRLPRAKASSRKARRPGLSPFRISKTSPPNIYLMSGYRPSGDRAIRIDMLERLADMLRAEDSRGGFEAKPDMLSITGMTLEQFANLMEGSGLQIRHGRA